MRKLKLALVVAVLTAPLVLVGGGSASAAVVTVPSTIPADCSVDVSADLNTWIAGLPNGTTASFAAGACYRIEHPVKVLNKTDFVVDGNGASFEQRSPSSPEHQYGTPTFREWNMRWLVQFGTRVTLQEMNIKGTNTVSGVLPGSPGYSYWLEPDKFGKGFTAASEGEAGVMIRESSYVTVDDVHTDATWGDGFQLGTENDAPVRNLVIKNSSVDRNGRQGFGVVGVEGGLFDNANVLHSWATGYDLEPNGTGASVKNIEIRNSTVYSRTASFSVSGATPTGSRSDNLYVHDNTVRWGNNSQPWFDGSSGPNQLPRQNWRIVHNTVINPSYSIELGAVTDAIVRDNVAPMLGQGTYPAVRTLKMAGVLVVTGNTFDKASAVVADNGTSTALILACNNKVLTAGAADQPRAC
jgi:hypothetical protein